MTLLVTLIFLLADGSPAKDARVVCPSIPTFAAGDDNGTPASGALILDSRGAVVLEVFPQELHCYASFTSQRGEWTIAVTDDAVIRLSLEAA